MPLTRTKNKIQFVQDILLVFTTFQRSGKAYLEYLHQSRSGDEFDVRDMIVKPLFRKLGYEDKDFYNEVTIQSGEVDLNIGTTRLQPVITVETKATSVKDLKSARVDQLFPYMKELHTPIGIVTNGRLFEVWEQKAGMHLLVNIDFVPIVAEYLNKDISGITDDDFSKIIKLMYLKKEIRYICEEDLYAIPEIDISEPTTFQSLLNDMAKMVEMTKVDVEEQFNLHLKDHKIFDNKQDQLEGWQLDKLRRDHKKSIQTMRYFHRWAELNNIDLEKNHNGAEKFITETMYILINRILLIRIAEDKEIIKRRISNGAIEDFKKFIGDVKINYNELLEIAYKTIKDVYEHLFKHDIFDWYVPDSELLLRLLFMFNKYNFAHVNRDILGNLYQKYIDKEERKRLGQFYTPDEVVQYILDGVGYTSDGEIENKTLLDPACGSGGFLVPAANRLIARLKAKNYDPITILHKVRDNIYGFDINPFAAHLTETNLLFQAVDLISEAKKLDSAFRMEQFNVFVTDSLKIPEENQKGKNMSLFDNGLLNSAAVYDAEIVKDIKLKRGRFKEGVDFVVGNPPYVKARDPAKLLSKYRKDLESSSQFKTLFQMWDIYIPFIEMGFHLLQKKGRFGFIVSDSFEKAKYAHLSRKFLVDNAKILEISFFKNAKLFDEAGVHNIIFTFEKATPTKTHKAKRIIHEGKIGESKQLERLNQIQFGELLFRSDFSPAAMEFDLSNTVDLCQICYVSYGLRLNADERYWRGEFKKFDLLSYHKDNIHTKDFIEAKNIERYSIKQKKFVEWDTDRVPQRLVRPTFPELYKSEKLMMTCVTLLNSDAIYDDNELVCDNTLIVAKPWKDLITIDNNSVKKEIKRIQKKYFPDNSQKDTLEILDETSRTISLKYILALINSSFASRFFLTVRRSKRHIYPDDYKRFPIKIVPLNVQNELISFVDKLLQLNKNIEDIKNQLNYFHEAIEQFKSTSPRYSDIQLVPLADIPGLKHIQLEKRLGKPDIRRESKRVHLAKNHYLDLATEPLAEYIELVLESMKDNLRGLTKPDILRMVQIPKDDKALRAILKYNSDLKKQKAKLEQQRDAIDREIDERVYELYGISKEERRIIEGK